MMNFIESANELFVEVFRVILYTPVMGLHVVKEELVYTLSSSFDFIDGLYIVLFVFVGILSLGMLIFYVALVCLATMKIFEVCTTTNVTEMGEGVVIDKHKSKSGGHWVPCGKTTTYIPESTNYHVDVRYKNYSDTITSSYLYDMVSKGDSINLTLKRRISRITGKETSFKLRSK